MPQITEIASQLAVENPFSENTPDVDKARQEWRETLYHTRENGFIHVITEAIEEKRPDLAPLCEELRG